MVAHGSERVIDDIKEHAYQISVTFNAFLLLLWSIDFNAACEELDMATLIIKLIELVLSSCHRHCPIFNTLILVGGTREIMSERNLRVLWLL